MPPGKEEAIEILAADLRPRERRLVSRIVLHAGICSAGVGIRPHQPPNRGDMLKARQKAPHIEPFA